MGKIMQIPAGNYFVKDVNKEKYYAHDFYNRFICAGDTILGTIEKAEKLN